MWRLTDIIWKGRVEIQSRINRQLSLLSTLETSQCAQIYDFEFGDPGRVEQCENKFFFGILAFKLYVVLFDNFYRIYNVKKKSITIETSEGCLNLRLKNPTMLNHFTNFSLIINGWVLFFRWERITLWTAKCACSKPPLVPSVWFGSVAMWWRTRLDFKGLKSTLHIDRYSLSGQNYIMHQNGRKFEGSRSIHH